MAAQDDVIGSRLNTEDSKTPAGRHRTTKNRGREGGFWNLDEAALGGLLYVTRRRRPADRGADGHSPAGLRRRRQLSVCQSVAAAKPTKRQCWTEQMGHKRCYIEHWRRGHTMGMGLNGVKTTTVPNESRPFR